MDTDAPKKQFKTSKTMVADQDDALRKINHLAKKSQALFDGNIITPMEQAVARLTETCAQNQARIVVLEKDVVKMSEEIEELRRSK